MQIRHFRPFRQNGPSLARDQNRIILVSVKIFVRNSGAGNGRANFMGAWKNALSLQEKPMPIKFLVLGGGILGSFQGGSADFVFMAMGKLRDKNTVN